MNSSLQCLLHIQPFIQYFLDENNEIPKNVNLSSPTKGVLAIAFEKLIKQILDCKEKSVTPSEFIRAVSKYAPDLLDYQQQGDKLLLIHF